MTRAEIDLHLAEIVTQVPDGGPSPGTLVWLHPGRVETECYATVAIPVDGPRPEVTGTWKIDSRWARILPPWDSRVGVVRPAAPAHWEAEIAALRAENRALLDRAEAAERALDAARRAGAEEERRQKIEETARALVARWEEAKPSMRASDVFAALHGFVYRGPNVDEAVRDLRDAIESGAHLEAP